MAGACEPTGTLSPGTGGHDVIAEGWLETCSIQELLFPACLNGPSFQGDIVLVMTFWLFESL